MPPTVAISTSHKFSEVVVRVTALMILKKLEVSRSGYCCCLLL